MVQSVCVSHLRISFADVTGFSSNNFFSLLEILCCCKYSNTMSYLFTLELAIAS